MAREAKICRGSWCLAFGFAQPATLDQVVKVLSAFGYDGIELGGFFDHATQERYPDKESRKKLVDWIGSPRVHTATSGSTHGRPAATTPSPGTRSCSTTVSSSASTAAFQPCGSTPATSGRFRVTPTTTGPGTAW